MKKSILAFQLLVFILVLIWSGSHPSHRSIWFFEVLPAVALVFVLLITYKRFPLTPLSYWVIFFGTIIMLTGGHYTYGGVPWFQAMKEMFHFKRNHFDRLGHIFQGMICTVLIREYFIRTKILKRKNWLFIIAGMLSISLSALYELFEFQIGYFFDPNVQNFLGYQGDIFDSHWDMISALIGTLVILFLSKIQNKQMQDVQSTSTHPPQKLQPN